MQKIIHVHTTQKIKLETCVSEIKQNGATQNNKLRKTCVVSNIDVNTLDIAKSKAMSSKTS